MRFGLIIITLVCSSMSFGGTISNCDSGARRIVDALEIIENTQTDFNRLTYTYSSVYDSQTGSLKYEVKVTPQKDISDLSGPSLTTYKIYKFKLSPATCTLVGEMSDVIVEHVL